MLCLANADFLGVVMLEFETGHYAPSSAGRQAGYLFIRLHRSLEREGENEQIDGYRNRHTRPIAIWQHANDTCLPSIKIPQTFPNVLVLRRGI